MKQFFHDLFYLPKHEKLTDRSFMKIVISSIAGITLCCLCLVSLTWAWFEDGVMSGRNSISSATFWTEVYIEKVDTPVVTNDDENEAPAENNGDADDANQAPDGEGQQSDDDGGEIVVMRSGSPYLLSSLPVLVIEDSSSQFPMLFKLEGGYKLENLEAGKYKITVTPKGTAREFGGYLVIRAEGKDTLYTEQLKVDEKFLFTFTVDGTISEYEFYCVWGSLPSGIEEKNIFKNELDEKASDKASSTDSSDASSDVNSIDESTSSIESEGVSSTESDVASSIESEAVTSSDESTSSIESEAVSSTESDVTSSIESDVVTSSAESEVTSSTESDVTSSIESDVVGSEESTDSSVQENTEDVDTEENSSEV